MAITMQRGIAVEPRRVRISSKRQITIPQKFYEALGFHDEAEVTLREGEIVIRPVAVQSNGEFAEYVLADLIEQGYNGSELLKRFREMQSQIRPAVESMIAEADAIAAGEYDGPSTEELFAED